jgi:glucosamine-6-phosphate deaminase
MTPLQQTIAEHSVVAPAPLETLECSGVKLFVYASADQMGLASALSLASEQCRLAREQGHTSMMIMAAPSAFAFYRAYIRLAHVSSELQAALRRTHFFQFDDYPLPAHHPASFRFLLLENLFMPLARYTDPAKVRLLEADCTDPDAACERYSKCILSLGPDLQLKGIGENGHWGFHEPGIPLEDTPRFMKVQLSESNQAQQMRDHPDLFDTPEKVPQYAYTANVALFLKTRRLIEENVPQASKALALLAAYGNDKVDAAVPSSALKGHPRAVIRTTARAAWALMKYRQEGHVSVAAQQRLADSLQSDQNPDWADRLSYVAQLLDHMAIRRQRMT